MGINLASYVGATQVRRMVLGDDDKQPTPAQLEQMRELVRQAMRDGAVGVSTSLEYAPAPYAKTEELIALAAEAGEIRRHLCHAHAQRKRCRAGGDRRGAAHRPRRPHPRGDMAPQSRGQGRIGDACPKSSPRSMLPAPRECDVTADTYAYTAWFNRFLGIHSAVGARWRRRQAGRAFEGSCDCAPASAKT